MENKNINNNAAPNEELPKAQSMKAANKKHMILVYAGLACWLIGLISSANDVSMIFTIIGIILNCIGIYKTHKYRSLSKKGSPSLKKRS